MAWWFCSFVAPAPRLAASKQQFEPFPAAFHLEAMLVAQLQQALLERFQLRVRFLPKILFFHISPVNRMPAMFAAIIAVYFAPGALAAP